MTDVHYGSANQIAAFSLAYKISFLLTSVSYGLSTVAFRLGEVADPRAKLYMILYGRKGESGKIYLASPDGRKFEPGRLYTVSANIRDIGPVRT